MTTFLEFNIIIMHCTFKSILLIYFVRIASQIQLTDFENAALVVFVVLLTRAILSFGLNFYIPISKVFILLVVSHVTIIMPSLLL